MTLVTYVPPGERVEGDARHSSQDKLDGKMRRAFRKLGVKSIEIERSALFQHFTLQAKYIFSNDDESTLDCKQTNKIDLNKFKLNVEIVKILWL